MASTMARLLPPLLKYAFTPFVGAGTNLRRTRWFLEISGKFLGPPPPPHPQTIVKPITVGHLSGEWVLGRDANDDHAILFLHGGGFVEGSVSIYRGLAARVAVASRSRVLLIDYRLAPENPFPAALDDCVASYKWLLAQGYEPGCVAIVGDSAGGGLTVSTLVSLRDDGVPLPAAAVCMSPWVDLAMGGRFSHPVRANRSNRQDRLLALHRSAVSGR